MHMKCGSDVQSTALLVHFCL